MGEESDVGRPDYWERRYQGGTDYWDLGGPAPGLLNWLAANPDSRGRAVVPGCGPGHDAVALARHGFDVLAIDFAASAIAATRERARAAGVALEAREADLFSLPSDLDHTANFVFEHTCFCAIDPPRRVDYVDVMARLLKPGGQLVGVFFTFPANGELGPPFTSTPAELRALFAPRFHCRSLELVPNSVEDRRGEEHLGVFELREGK